VADTDDLRTYIEAKLAENPNWRPWHEDRARLRREDGGTPNGPDLPSDEEIARWDAEFETIGNVPGGGLVGVGGLNDYAKRRRGGERLRSIWTSPDSIPDSLISPGGYLIHLLAGDDAEEDIAAFYRVTGDGWLVSGSVAYVEGILHLSSLDIRPNPGGAWIDALNGRGPIRRSAGITGRFLEGIRPEAIVREINGELSRLPKALASWRSYWKSRGIPEPGGLKVTESQLGEIRERVRGARMQRGRNGHSKEVYRAVAVAHVKASQMKRAGHTGKIMDLTAEEFEKYYGEPYPAGVKGMQYAVRKAESLGFLTPARNGTAGRDYGPKFKREK
jgi:hypothetical protein